MESILIVIYNILFSQVSDIKQVKSMSKTFIPLSTDQRVVISIYGPPKLHNLRQYYYKTVFCLYSYYVRVGILDMGYYYSFFSFINVSNVKIIQAIGISSSDT